jgi:hypothetical protein
MRKKRRKQIAFFGIVFGIVVFYLILNNIDRIGDIGGDWSSITTSMISYLPSLIGIGTGFYFTLRDRGNYRTQPIRILLMFGLIGISFSGLFFQMNSDGIWIDEIVTASYTITDFQLSITLISLLFGMVYGMIKR